MKLLDMRQHNEEVRTGYFAMAVFVYGFLIVIALVALINIINTVNASVSSRINHYGVMRAVGMSGKQIQKVIRAEAAAYAITGSIAGAISGLFLHRFFFEMLITSNWGAGMGTAVIGSCRSNFSGNPDYIYCCHCTVPED